MTVNRLKSDACVERIKIDFIPENDRRDLQLRQQHRKQDN
jgi:hypothetical protein